MTIDFAAQKKVSVNADVHYLHSGRVVGKPDNESSAATCDSLNFLFARDPLRIHAAG